MLLSIFVYTATFLIMFTFALCLKDNKVAILNNRKIFKRWDIIMALVFAVVFGIRYNVGVDYEAYKIIYQFQYIETVEYLFKYLTKLLYGAGFDVAFYFGLWAFGQIYFLLKSFKDEKYIYPSLIFTLFAGQYFLLWMNVIRQDLAACIFIYSITFIVNRNLLKYLICIVLAFGLHKSAIMLLMFYPLFQFKKNIFNNIYVQFGLLVISVFMAFNSAPIMNLIDSHFEQFTSLLGYDNYTMNGIEKRNRGFVVGFSFTIGLIIDFFIILNSKKMKEFYKNDRFFCFYDLYFVGICLNYILAESFILLRPVRYFRFFKMIISAYLIYYLHKNRSLRFNMMSLILILVCYFVLYALIFKASKDSMYIYNVIGL